MPGFAGYATPHFRNDVTFEHVYLYLCEYIYVYVYMYVHVFVYMYIYIYITLPLSLSLALSLSLSLLYMYMYIYIYIYLDFDMFRKIVNILNMFIYSFSPHPKSGVLVFLGHCQSLSPPPPLFAIAVTPHDSHNTR